MLGIMSTISKNKTFRTSFLLIPVKDLSFRSFRSFRPFLFSALSVLSAVSAVSVLSAVSDVSDVHSSKSYLSSSFPHLEQKTS